ncbi:MAG: hypothetical protein IAG10_19720 [Planctomycetaceae bacterium]|nr:hypothetical protein [Planctomycetaceae bacterium]
MKCRGRWAVVGLLCVCSAIGCAQLPTRGLFVRRPNPAATEEASTDEPDDTARDDETFALSDNSDDLSRDAQPADSSGGLFDVSSGGASSDRFSVVEAPSPKRRAATAPQIAESRPPNTFTPPDNLRELRPTSPQNFIELASGFSTSGSLDTSGGVVTADFAQSTSGGYSSDIELAAGQQRASNTANGGAANPWDRFRGLTNNLAPNENRPEQPLASERPSVTNLPTVNPSPSWPQAFAPATANNTAGDNTNAPELWPRAPGVPGANSAAAPQNVQWVNSEQPAANNGTLSGLPFPSQRNPPVFDPTANGPLNFGRPEGAPAAIVPFATSPELERLITQTTVEAAALIPGDNEFTRQLYLQKHVQLRLLHLMAGQMDRALQPVPGIDPADQEFWQQMLWGMANYFDTQGMPDSSERATQTIAQLKSATARLQEKARLELHNVAFCYKISGFGNYQRFKRDEFTPCQPVLLYAEVGNFKSELVSEGQFRTLLKSTLEIVDGGPTGRVVETLPLAPSEDRCRNQRRDYYHSYEFTIPQGCNPGPHTLRLRVEDQLGKKLAVTKLNFTVQ